MTITLPETKQPEVDEASEQLIADLQGARDLIARHGLVKEFFFDINGGGYCAVGAMAKAITGAATDYRNPRIEKAYDAVSATLGGHSGMMGRSSIYDFNDNPVTQKSDVLGLFDTTIARLRG